VKVEYSLKINAQCPVDGKRDLYDCVIVSTSTLQVEKILAEIKDLPKAFQEEITVELARSLGAEVTTTGWHSGVKTVVTA